MTIFKHISEAKMVKIVPKFMLSAGFLNTIVYDASQFNFVVVSHKPLGSQSATYADEKEE